MRQLGRRKSLRLYKGRNGVTTRETQNFASLHEVTTQQITIDNEIMSDKYQNTYRIQTARASWHNYDGGIYFITICTKDYKQYFGRITHHAMNLSPIGECAKKCLEAIPSHFPHVEIPLSTVMPNHIHCILIIKDPHLEKKTITSQRPHNEYGPQSMNLASVIRGFKIGVTKFARTAGLEFAWQPRFYDHVICNNDDLNRIATYIENNVGSWDKDKLNHQDD